MQKHSHKLIDGHFWAILKANGALYARTAKAIKQRYGITYTRQSVAERAKKHPELLEEAVEEALDLAEETLQHVMRTGKAKERLRAAEVYLKAKGKNRGYGIGSIKDQKHSEHITEIAKQETGFQLLVRKE